MQGIKAVPNTEGNFRKWRLVVPLMTTAFFYGLALWISQCNFAVGCRPAAESIVHFFQHLYLDVDRFPLADFAGQLLLGYSIFFISRRIWQFAVVQAILIGFLYVGSAIKISFLGGPLIPSDIHAFTELLTILDGAHLYYFLGPLILGTLLLVMNLRLTALGTVCSVGIISLYTLLVNLTPATVVAYADHNYDYLPWDQAHNYEQMGATVFLTQAMARAKLEVDPVPDQTMTAEAVDTLHTTQSADFSQGTPALFSRRNVYMLVLESFWDAGQLVKAGLSQDPLDPGFRDLWRQAGNSRAMSPVFAGETANAEFELLCGQPVNYSQGVIFQHALTNDGDCLPRILAEQGYATYGAHPNVPAFWNRVNAYRWVGLQRVLYQDDLDFDDMNGPFLADESLYRQVLSTVAADAVGSESGPKLVYIMTITGHWGYPLNDEKRPQVLTATSAIDEVEKYSNSLWYSSRELMALIRRIRLEDPTALIVATGDHLPNLGPNLAGYVESGLLADAVGKFTPEMMEMYSSTPLLIIDGQRGPVDVGTVAMYEVPAIVLQLLGHEEELAMDLFAPPAGAHVRTYGWSNLLLQDGKAVMCRHGIDQPECGDIMSWVDATRVLSNDLMRGNQYGAKLMLKAVEGEMAQGSLE